MASSAKGLGGHLRRAVKARVEKEEKARLDAALAQGVLHKRAVVRDADGRTVVKPFALVTDVRAASSSADSFVFGDGRHASPTPATAHGRAGASRGPSANGPASSRPSVPVGGLGSFAAVAHSPAGGLRSPAAPYAEGVGSSVGLVYPSHSSYPSTAALFGRLAAAPPALPTASATGLSYSPSTTSMGFAAPTAPLGAPLAYQAPQAHVLGEGGRAPPLGSSGSAAASVLTVPPVTLPTDNEPAEHATEPASADLVASAGPSSTPLMYVDVTVSADRVERIPIWTDSDLPTVAADFAAKHGLPKRMAKRLERMMETQRNGVLTGTSATAPAAEAQ